jgi:hypothetical protein
MASQVKPNNKPLPYDEKPLPPSADLENPDDYKNTFKVSFLGWRRTVFPAATANEQGRAAISKVSSEARYEQSG